MFTKDDPDKLNQPVSPIQYKPPGAPFQPVNLGALNPGDSYMTPGSTVENRVAGIMGKDTPLMRIANTQAKQMGENRGLLNSGSNVAAGLTARANTALQIATPDANNNAAMNARQQMTENQGALNTQTAGNNFQAQRQSGEISGALAEQQQAFSGQIEHEKNLFAKQLAELGYDQQKIQSFSNIYGNLVDSQISAMGQIMRTPGQTWSQTMQNDFEKVVNATKPWLASLFDIPLS